MAHVPLALSVQSFIDKVGADAGFASIIGLAILVFLYFAQARETSTLRDNAEQSEERVRQLEAQVAHLGRAQAAVQTPAGEAVAPAPGAVQPAVRPVPAAPVAVPARAVAAVAAPSPPAGVGAPALAAATRLIPISSPVAPVPAAATGALPAPTTAPGAVAPVPAPVSVPAPATAAGGNGASGGSTSPPPPPPPAFAPQQPPPPRVQLRPGGAADAGRRPSPAASTRRTTSERSRFGRGLAILLTVLGLGAVVAILLIVTSGGGGSNATNGRTPTTNAPSATHPSKHPAFNPSSVTVTVLNGTPTSGAAAKISGQLGGIGYTQGLTTNADNQLHTVTTVGYLPGHRVAATAVAKALKLASNAVAPVDSSAQTLACTSTPCSADVVVVVGADLANK